MRGLWSLGVLDPKGFQVIKAGYSNSLMKVKNTKKVPKMTILKY